METKLKISKDTRQFVLTDGLSEVYINLDFKGENIIPEIESLKTNQQGQKVQNKNNVPLSKRDLNLEMLNKEIQTTR